MPRTRRTTPTQTTAAKQPSQENLHYLAGVFEATRTLAGVNVNSAVAISRSSDWAKFMEQTFGQQGSASSFVGGKSGRTWWGWFPSLQRRLDLIIMLQKADVARATTSDEFEKFKNQIQKAINNQQVDENLPDNG